MESCEASPLILSSASTPSGSVSPTLHSSSSSLSPKSRSKTYTFTQYNPSIVSSPSQTKMPTSSLKPNMPPLQLSATCSPPSPTPVSPFSSGKISPPPHVLNNHNNNSMVPIQQPQLSMSRALNGSNGNLRLSTSKFLGPRSPSSGNEREKKRRTRLKKEQSTTLKNFFEKDNYPNKEDKEMLANYLGMSYTAVTTWFSNKRQEKRRKVTDGTGGRRVPVPAEDLNNSQNNLDTDLQIDDSSSDMSTPNSTSSTPASHTSLTPLISGIGLHHRHSPMDQVYLNSPLNSPSSHAIAAGALNRRGGGGDLTLGLSILSQAAKGDLDGLNPSSPFTLNSPHNHSSPISSPRSPINRSVPVKRPSMSTPDISDSDDDEYFDSGDEMLEYDSDFEDQEFDSEEEADQDAPKPSRPRSSSVSMSSSSKLKILEIASRRHNRRHSTASSSSPRHYKPSSHHRHERHHNFCILPSYDVRIRISQHRGQ
eukprot:gene6817-7922_t